MKKALKILGYGIGSIAALILIALTVIHFRGVPDYTYAPGPEIENLQVPRDSAHIARGAVIGAMHCVACHAGPDGKMTGKPLADLPPMFGELHSLNITQDSVHGIGAWTDGELYYFLRTGIHKDGRWSPPFMPKYALMADEDLKSVIAWLRSGEQRLQPDSREYPPNKFNLFVKVLGNTLFVAPPLPPQPIVVPDTSNMVKYGEYVANGLSDCFACHCADILKVAAVPAESAGFYGGGTQLMTEDGKPIFTPNLTMDKETGIGNWTEQQFIDAVKYGKKPQGGTLSYPMMPHSMLSDHEVRAIHKYLQTVPVIHNPVVRFAGN